MEVIIKPDSLRGFEIAIFKKLNMSVECAKTLSECLIEADLQGISSHGAIRIPVYARRIREGLTDISSDITVSSDYPSSVVIDGNNIVGQIASEKAMNMAIEKASVTGIACASLGNINHSGTCGHYSMMAARCGMIGLSFVNTTPLVAVFGGTSKAVGNNPLSIAIPAKNHFPILLDMACSAAQGKIELLQKQGKPVPEGWAVDADGHPTTDPAKALKGVLLPIAGPKGSGLAIAIDILCGALSGAGIGPEIGHLNDSRPQNIGAFFIVIDISKFTSLDHFLERVDEYIDYLKGTARAGEQIMMPGELNFLMAERRVSEGIPLPITLVDELNSLAEELGISERLEGDMS